MAGVRRPRRGHARRRRGCRVADPGGDLHGGRRVARAARRRRARARQPGRRRVLDLDPDRRRLPDRRPGRRLLVGRAAGRRRGGDERRGSPRTGRSSRPSTTSSPGPPRAGSRSAGMPCPTSAALDVRDVGSLASRVRGLKDRLSATLGDGVGVSTGLPDILTDAERSLLVSRTGVLLLTVQLVVLAAYAVLLSASLLIEHRRDRHGHAPIARRGALADRGAHRHRGGGPDRPDRPRRAMARGRGPARLQPRRAAGRHRAWRSSRG